ncbi:MAG: TolC family protein, partial [Isosphaeraceae bacterium]
VQLWSSEKAVDLAREILSREQAELVVGKGTRADVAEAQQRLEQFSLDLVTRTSDLITTERQLRNLLGLPPADNRRIIPVTPPTEARLEPDWDASLAQMLSFYPDIVAQEIAVRISELNLVIARNQLLPQLNLNFLYQLNGLGQSLDTAEGVMTGQTIKALEPVTASQERAAGLIANPGFYNNFRTWQVGLTFQMPLGMRSPLANSRFAQYNLLRQRAFLQQMVHQRTHQLARFYLEIDANYKQFKTASRLRAAAAERLEAQRAYYEEGRITIDRFLDAVSQYAQAVATEAEYKTMYNISIIVFEEAKGTLLSYNNIAVAEGPQPQKAYRQAKDIQNAHRKLPIPHNGPMYNPPVSGPVNPDPVPANPPPGLRPGQVPALPAPAGPAGPDATPVPPYRPAGEPPILSRNAPAAATAPGTGEKPLFSPMVGNQPRVDSATKPTGAPGTPEIPPAMLPDLSTAASRVHSDSPPPPGGPAALGASLATGARPAIGASAPTQGAPVSANPEPGDELPVLPQAIGLPPLPPT